MIPFEEIIAGAVLFNLHALDIKDELQMLLFDLVKEKLVLWKQMRCLEVTAAIVAETLMKMGVQIMMSPEEITWPTGEVTKPAAPPSTKKKGGKKVAKNKHGVFGKLVNDLAPKLPSENDKSTQRGTESDISSKRQPTHKVKPPKSAVKSSEAINNDSDDDNDICSVTHSGLQFKQESVSCIEFFAISKFLSHLVVQFTTISLEMCTPSDWKLNEQADILYLYKTVQMDANYKNNYKELARRMKDAGWLRDNDQCHHQVNNLK